MIVNSSPVEVIHASDRFASVVSNLQFTNNTVVNASGSAKVIWVGGGLSGSSALVVRNNIFNGYGVIMDSGSAFSHDHNLYNLASGGRLGFSLGSAERQANPQFVNLGGGDYHLQASSPAINSGAGALYASDYDGKAVPSGGAVDLGAFEYGGTAPPPPGPTPTPPPPPLRNRQTGRCRMAHLRTRRIPGFSRLTRRPTPA